MTHQNGTDNDDPLRFLRRLLFGDNPFVTPSHPPYVNPDSEAYIPLCNGPRQLPIVGLEYAVAGGGGGGGRPFTYPPEPNVEPLDGEPHAAGDDALAYNDPHAEQTTVGWTADRLRRMRAGFYYREEYFSPGGFLRPLPKGHNHARAERGWHGPLPLDLHDEHVQREHERAAERRAAHVARLALQARRDANPMWERLDGVMPRERCDEDVDAVMDTVYGEGRW